MPSQEVEDRPERAGGARRQAEGEEPLAVEAPREGQERVRSPLARPEGRTHAPKALREPREHDHLLPRRQRKLLDLRREVRAAGQDERGARDREDLAAEPAAQEAQQERAEDADGAAQQEERREHGGHERVVFQTGAVAGAVAHEHRGDENESGPRTLDDGFGGVQREDAGRRQREREVQFRSAAAEKIGVADEQVAQDEEVEEDEE